MPTAQPARSLLGVDTGGTFTDFLHLDLTGKIRTHKVLSTPKSPEQAIVQGIAEMAIEPGSFNMIHGSTVATNAVLEGHFSRTAYITNHGLADTLIIGRQQRLQLYHLQPDPPDPLIEEALRLEIGGRLDASGQCITPLTEDDLQTLLKQLTIIQPDAVAINLLFSFLNDHHEQTIRKGIEQHFGDRIFVSSSADILPEYREYERGIVTWLNAALGPLVHQYLNHLRQQLPSTRISIMQSSGKLASLTLAAQRPVNLLLSGPAGGLNGARHMAGLAGFSRLLTFDMGGTSTDVSLIDGDIRLTSEGSIDRFPISIPMVDMHTIGAGGGSIAYIDSGGMLQVGPQSAGASPGPACYGLGGQSPTVTDANLVLGHFHPDFPLANGLRIRTDLAERAIHPLAQKLGLSLVDTAEGILQIANEHMAQALRTISVERGVDPRKYTLVSFGGAGGLHVCDLADAMGMSKALVPAYSGILSALGMLVTPPGQELSRTVMKPLKDCSTAMLHEQFDLLLEAGRERLFQDGLDPDSISEMRSVDLRYQGQHFTLNLICPPSADAPKRLQESFHHEHLAYFGHRLNREIELVNLRVSLLGKQADIPLQDRAAKATLAEPVTMTKWLNSQEQIPVYLRESLAPEQHLAGPAMVMEKTATTLVRAGWMARSDRFGNLVLQRA
ncbi:MAG: hydantoinase/oxoprolinase family protein [Gammaproteobacteria bacterium]|nr:MAG: hydantoinase/oxoprolinase family protein [Gammaproteobacteria bacterium]